MTDWISMDEEQPPLNEEILVCDCCNNFVSIGKLITASDGHNGTTLEVLCDTFEETIQVDTVITHWMPKPKSASWFI